MYYVFVLFIGCYRANLQNILLLHLSEAAVSHVGFILICRAKFLQNPVLQNYLHTSNQ